MLHKLLFFIFFNLFSSNSFIFTYKPLVNKNKLVTFGPGGITGFYTLGVTSYLKDNYNLTDYSFLGASAGSWNALLLTCKENNSIIINKLLSQDMFHKSTSVSNLLADIKTYVETTYKASDFELNKLYISVSVLNLFRFKPRVLYNFTSLHDATNGCFYSSYIPFLTGKVKFLYLKNFIFDGGIGKFPPNHIRSYFDVYPSMWGRQFTSKDRFIYPTDTNYFKNIYELGYNDSCKNKHILDLYFSPLNNLEF
tara:strand:+ start:122 stop:877 length:756 start_codon:yes stop_codon:yes gene_type:complete